MKVLGILGSPRRGGNSEIILEEALAGAKSAGFDTDKIILNELKFSLCQECDYCEKNGKCVQRDDMRIVYKKMDEADSIIIASPIFFGSLSAQVKAMIDRYQFRWKEKYVLGKKTARASKKGFLILVSGANRKSFFKNAESIIKNLFAVLDIEFKGNVYCPGVNKKGEVLNRPDCLKQAFELGKDNS